jgi:chromosome segregation ATPase
MKKGLDNGQKGILQESRRRKKELIKSLEKEIKIINTSSVAVDKKLKIKKRNRSHYEDKINENSFSNLSFDELELKHAELEKSTKALMDSANAIWQEVYALQKEAKRIRAEIKRIKSQNMQRFKEVLKDIEDRLGKNGLDKFDSLPHFEENAEWQDADVVQQDFDREATDSGDKIVNNGLSKVGSGSRSVWMSLKITTTIFLR